MPLLLADFILARVCKPICAKLLTLPSAAVYSNGDGLKTEKTRAWTLPRPGPLPSYAQIEKGPRSMIAVLFLVGAGGFEPP